MPRILVVDDDAAILKLVSVILARAGHEVRTSSHPVEALDLLQVFTPELIIRDVVMPYMTGLEFLVAFLQAYVFAVLTCMYLNDAVHPGGH